MNMKYPIFKKTDNPNIEKEKKLVCVTKVIPEGKLDVYWTYLDEQGRLIIPLGWYEKNALITVSMYVTNKVDIKETKIENIPVQMQKHKNGAVKKGKVCKPYYVNYSKKNRW